MSDIVDGIINMTSMNRNSTDGIEKTFFDEWTWSFRTIIVLTICSLITILTILGNGIVLISVKFRLRTRSYSDCFIVSLCLADFFVGLFVMPLMTIHSLHLRWPFHYRLCYIWMSIDFTCSTASFLTLASMALDRYWALTAPYFHLRNRSYSSVLIFIISSWAIPFAIWPGSIFLAHFYSKTEPTCVHPARPFIILILCTFFYYIPLLFMLVCYSRIIVNIKNIEVLIRDTWDTINFNPSAHDLQTSILTSKSALENSSLKDKNSQRTISSIFSLRSFCDKYLPWNRTKKLIKNQSLFENAKPLIKHDIVIPCRPNSNEYSHVSNQKRRATLVNQGIKASVRISKSSLPLILISPNLRTSRQTTTATFTGQKRSANETIENPRYANEFNLKFEEEQQLVRARLNTRTSSLPAARCISYYYCQQRTPPNTITTKAIIENQHRDIANGHVYPNNSLTPERSRSQSHSSGPCPGNNGVATTDTDHSSSFENALDEEHHRLNRRTPPSHISTAYNSSRYSQRAITQFMHERHQARLRRNQKASRMLGILLAVFLICWLPFAISYPTMIFYPTKFPSSLESIIFWFGYVNSLLNPFLYVYSSRNFRQAIMETICCYVRLRTREQLRYQWSIRAGHK